MPRGQRPSARYGFADTPAVAADFAVVSPDARLLAALSRAGHPELALRQLASLLRALPEAEAAELRGVLDAEVATRGRLIGLFGASEPLGTHVVNHPHSWGRFRHDDFSAVTDRARCDEELDAAIRDGSGAVLTPAVAVGPLRTAYRHRLALIAAADVAPSAEPELAGPTVAAVGEALATLADALLSAALTVAAVAYPVAEESYRGAVDVGGVKDAGGAEGAGCPEGARGAGDTKGEPGAGSARLAIIAMGKCGGRELNYLSDVDVVFAIPDGDSASVATDRARAVMMLCGQAAWEVDAALRPEGGAGPLVRTLDGYRTYYHSWAKTWEFQALLKARFAAGDAEVGAAFLDLITPQVWAAADRPDFVTDVQQMRLKVRDSVPVGQRDRELKLSAGGLRDVEFAVQLLQLVHGREDETLRVGGTIAALRALTDGGYVGRSDGADLTDAYTFLRRVEHLLQLQHLRRTHSLPTDATDRAWLARMLGMEGDPGRLTAELTRYATVVRRLHEKLFYRPLLAAVAAVPSEELRLSRSSAEARLAALGFRSPAAALRHIAALTEGVSRRAAIQRTLLPVLLGNFAAAPDPDAGLLRYRTVSDALAGTPWYLRLLRDEGFVAQRLADLLGLSRLVADLLERAPEVLRLLVSDRDLAQSPRAVGDALLAQAARAKTADAAAAAARSARRHEMARVACADLLHVIDTGGVVTALTEVADATVLAALSAAHRAVVEDRGELAARVAVIAMGRFGGGEMGYSSDADVLFVAAPEPGNSETAAVADASAIAELTVRLLGKATPDPPLLIDADLRPEGRSGPLVRTIDSYRRYWDRNVQPWHRQALLRARAIGDDPIGREFLSAIDPIRYPEGGLVAADIREIRRIKARVDTERLPRGADRTLHTKLGRGGLADIEWTVQLLQLRYGHEHPELRRTGTLAALDGAADSGLISTDDRARLCVGWLAATRARHAIMVVTGKPDDEIPPHGPELAAIARACGYAADRDPGEFVDDYRRATRRARVVVDRVFDEVPTLG